MRIRRADPILKVPGRLRRFGGGQRPAASRHLRCPCACTRTGEFILATGTSYSNLLLTLDIATRVWSTSRGTRPPSRPGALRRLSERAIVTTLLMPAPLDVDDEIGGVVRRALPIPYVGGSRIQPSSVQSA